ncbi:LacI family DNA-binding transcriptional regulator [Ammoniphilus sp. 3BR4]|uniref:LacI family DNA-binding transcriptional regulator n=1 Tax=Ammoniphilus sp. 3BR4 TaxID=3158265 RepID=UPI003466DC50
MITIKDIANAAGVSTATVSYVLNNTRYVSPDKKDRVLKAVSDLNYVPNAVARGLRVQKSKAISLIVSDITNPFYPDLAKACEDVAQSRGYTINIVNTNDEAKLMAEAVSQIREGRIDGLIITCALEPDRPVIDSLSKEGYPIVLAHRKLEKLDVDTVISDHFSGGLEAARHLIRLGHERIAFMTGVKGSTVSLAAKQGYLEAMEEARLPVLEEWNIPGEAKYQESYEAAKQLISLPKSKRPTAVLNIGDVGSLGVMDAAFDLNLRVPEDLAIIGFDDLFFSSTRNIQLSTVRIPRYELGRRATEILINRIQNKGSEEKQDITLPVELIIRRTCGAKS